jgi:hypothetical protein
VAARLMKDAKLFERIGQPDAARNVGGEPQARSERETKPRLAAGPRAQRPAGLAYSAFMGRSGQRGAR